MAACADAAVRKIPARVTFEQFATGVPPAPTPIPVTALPTAAELELAFHEAPGNQTPADAALEAPQPTVGEGDGEGADGAYSC